MTTSFLPSVSEPDDGFDLLDPRDSRPGRMEERNAIRRATGLGLIIWPSFLGLDAYMALVAVPEASLGAFLIYRVFFELCIFITWRVSQRPKSSLRLMRLAVSLMASGAAVVITLMARDLGGLTSPYVHGLSIILLVMAVSIPVHWRRSLVWLVPTALAFPGVMGVLATFDPAVRASWLDPSTLSLFGANYVFVLAAAVIGSVSSHRVWLARQQVYQARRIGRYRLKAPIGKGAMNEVWLAWDTTLRRDVALKILRASEGDQRRSFARFLREARALSRMTSPHTVRVFDFGGSEDGLYYIAMEYLMGRDLLRLVHQAGPLPAARAVHVARQVCRSLSEAHRHGLIHRDVKPANIFVTRTDHERDLVKVVDFGLARALVREAEASQSMVFAGTPYYMAPELWQGGAAHVGSDLYALGATLYFILVGREPFGDSHSVEALAQAHIGASVDPPSRHQPGVPHAVDAIVLRCLEKDPAARYASADGLLDALNRCPDIAVWTEADAEAAWRATPELQTVLETRAILGESQSPTVVVDRDGRRAS